jgi:nucleotide-binding universal stress UspA family protein
MNTAHHRPVIVVGVSGSPASAGALRWAADEAKRRPGQLKVVLIWSVGRRAYYAPPLSPQEAGICQRRAGDDLAATLRAVLGPGSRDNVTMEVAEGMAERALVQLSAGADLLVLGSASGQLAGRSIGPVIRTCLSRAHCPVVVVGPEGPGGDEPPRADTLTEAKRDRRELQFAGAGQPARS